MSGPKKEFVNLLTYIMKKKYYETNLNQNIKINLKKKMMHDMKFQKYLVLTNWMSKKKMKNLIGRFYRECKKGKSFCSRLIYY